MLRSFHFTTKEFPLKGNISPVSFGERLLSNQSFPFFSEITTSPNQASLYFPIYIDQSGNAAPDPTTPRRLPATPAAPRLPTAACFAWNWFTSPQIESVIFLASSNCFLRTAAYCVTLSVPAIPK